MVQDGLGVKPVTQSDWSSSNSSCTQASVQNQGQWQGEGKVELKLVEYFRYSITKALILKY